jgi:DNA-binding response OmpR family regulator
MEKSKILVVDDEESMVTVIRYALEEAGFEVAAATDTTSACELVASFAPDLLILDVMLPGGSSGLDLCRDIRARSAVPIIMLSARSEELDRVLGLELGADDYVTKPFSPRELVSRVKAHLRRSGPLSGPPSMAVEIGDLRIDSDSHEDADRMHPRGDREARDRHSRGFGPDTRLTFRVREGPARVGPTVG